MFPLAGAGTRASPRWSCSPSAPAARAALSAASQVFWDLGRRVNSVIRVPGSQDAPDGMFAPASVCRTPLRCDAPPRDGSMAYAEEDEVCIGAAFVS